MEATYCPKVASEIEIEPLPGEGCGEMYFVLAPLAPGWVIINRDGVELLRLCNGERTLAEIAGHLSRQTGADPGEVRDFAVSFLDRMRRSCILGEEERPQRPENRFQGVALEITRKCNLRCCHCYLAAGHAAADELTGEEIRSVVDQVVACGGLSVAVGGGEPLLHPEWLAIIEHALAAGLLVSVGTNATLVDARTAAILAGLPIKIQISLDGASEAVHDSIRGRGSYRATVRGIDALVDSGKAEDLVIAFTPMRQNRHEVSAIIDFARDRGIPVVQYPPLTRSGRADERWQELCLDAEQTGIFWQTVSSRAEELQGEMDLLADCFSINIHRAGVPYQCSIGTQFRIDPAGDVYPCQCFHGGRDFLLGNVRTHSLSGMVSGGKLRRIRELSRRRPRMITRCRKCRWQGYCGGGCMGGAYEISGDILASPACEVRRQWIESRFASIMEQMK